MILSPLQNSAVLQTDWIQKRPRQTQAFGSDFQQGGKWVYQSMGMKGHNGLDFGVPVGTPLFAPFDGTIKLKKDKGGYGWHVKLRSREKLLECVIGHMSSFSCVDGQIVNMGDPLGMTGNTGFSTAPHLHFGLRRLKLSKKSLFNMEVSDYDNGYFGYFDPTEFTICWKGSLFTNSL